MKGKTVLGLAVVAVGMLLMASTATGDDNGLAAARAATAKFHDFNVALADGRGEFQDAAGIACIDDPTGGMGIHYVKGSIVGDGAIDATDPEAVIYEPEANGRMRLVAVEYVVFQADWDAKHATPPSLFGEPFTAVGANNRYGLPPFYELHAWIWKNNPSGMFNDWNPNVSCANA